jgi:hypothetical protein
VFCSVLFCFVLFCSVLLCSLLCSVVFSVHAVLFVFCSFLFYSVLNCSARSVMVWVYLCLAVLCFVFVCVVVLCRVVLYSCALWHEYTGFAQGLLMEDSQRKLGVRAARNPFRSSSIAHRAHAPAAPLRPHTHYPYRRARNLFRRSNLATVTARLCQSYGLSASHWIHLGPCS